MDCLGKVGKPAHRISDVLHLVSFSSSSFRRRCRFIDSNDAIFQPDYRQTDSLNGNFLTERNRFSTFKVFLWLLLLPFVTTV